MNRIGKKYIGVICAVDGCESGASCPHETGPICNAHYLRYRRFGSFDLPNKISATSNAAYKVWQQMKFRCSNPKATGYENYGGRGITVCAEWSESFDAFIRDVGPRPSASHTLDRVDVNGGYEPGNCRWATQKVQCRNMRVNHIVRLDGVSMTLAEAAELAPVPYNTVLYRLKRGWTVNDAVSLLPQKGVRP